MKNLEVKYIESDEYEYFIIPATDYEGLELFIRRKDIGMMQFVFGVPYTYNGKNVKTRVELEKIIYKNIEDNDEDYKIIYEEQLDDCDKKDFKI